MAGSPPVSITTDYDPVIHSAIMHVLPGSHHRFCKWHILKKSQEKLSHVFLTHPITVEEFEICWLSLVDKYDLRGHEWLQCLYSA
ncbi:hypothetical protein LIER_03704 [Lithospermum erythrorhizon]|uniref:Protein FAR1-RELATED SEQUENCE n=1 Tax=Lithospermum erythrorhizon TaxID=34254 RepID=A0AAV3NVL2_LITER